jgi:hypothetical protein
MTSKICSRCKLEKDLTEYYKNKSKFLGVCNECKECNKMYSKTSLAKSVRQKRRNDPEVKEKEKQKYKEYYHRPEVNEKYAKYRNSPEVKKRMKTYFETEKVKEKIKQRNKDNLPERNRKFRERYKNDENFRIAIILKTKIHKLINGLKTSYKTILGCELEFFKKWIEFRFDENMTWDNLGKLWEIDHILPVSAFDFTDKNNINICFHWTNLQPLICCENKSKSAKLELHYYYNNIVNVHRFNQKYNQFLGYQAIRESNSWLRRKISSMVKKPQMTLDFQSNKIDNPQPSS